MLGSHDKVEAEPKERQDFERQVARWGWQPELEQDFEGHIAHWSWRPEFEQVYKG